MNLDRLATVLSPKQIRSIAEANARICVWAGAVRSGKTVASLLRWLIYVASAPRGELVVVAKTSQTAMRNVFAPLQDFAVTGELATQTRYTPGAAFGTILGRRVWVIGANDVRAETRLRGLTAAGALVDETSLVSEEFFTQLLARMSVPGAKLFATTNPDNPGHWLRKNFILREGELDLKHWHFTLRDNPSLTEKYIRDLATENVGLFYRRRVLGEWCLAAGSVFDMFDEDRHVVDVLPVMKRWIAAGVDYGARAEFAAVVLALGTDRRLYFTSEWYWDSVAREQRLSDVQYSAKMRDFFASIRHPGSQLYGIRPEYVVVDPSASHFITQLHNDRHLFQGGLNVMGANNAVDDGIQVMSSLLATGRLKVHRSCQHMISQIQGYSWDEKAAERGEDKVVKKDDHLVDAGRYALLTTRSQWRNLLLPAEAPPNYQDQFGVAL